jgi:hypothetical protein
MGQFITVSVQAGVAVGAHLHLNRSITGMARECVRRRRQGRSSLTLARRLFDLGAERVTVYSSSCGCRTTERWASSSPR